MSLIHTLDPEVNFWELYPDFKIKEPFKTLYKEDKAKNKKSSSMMMWFVCLCHAKTSSFRNLPLEGIDGKYNIIGEDYCGDINYYYKNQLVLDSLIEEFISMELLPIEAHMKVWEELLHNRTTFIKSQRYDLNTYEDLDKMAIGTDKVYSTIKKIQEDINKEDAAGVGKGGAVSSLND